MLAQILWLGGTIAEVSCPTRYEVESSSINFRRSVTYGFGCLGVGLEFRLARWGLGRPSLFPPDLAPAGAVKGRAAGCLLAALAAAVLVAAAAVVVYFATR